MEKNIDFYFDEHYGELYEKLEGGKAEIFKYEDENGVVTNQFIKREIKDKVDGKTYYDLTTPYGYGGPVINKCTGDKKLLVKNYEEALKKYCLENDIVSEFVRFHPIVENALDFKEVYNSQYSRKTLITKLDDEDIEHNQISKSARKNIRRAFNRGVTYKVIEKPDDISIFKNIYYSTMDRNNATEYYYFDDEYFNMIEKYYKNNLILIEAILEDKVIAAGIYFTYNDLIHIHLSGTLTEYLYLSPAYVLRYALILWGKEHKNQYKLIHHGGGRSSSSEDNLYLFKKNFAEKYDVDFYLGKKIWNQEIYNKLCDIKKVDRNEEFFPAYRKEH